MIAPVESVAGLLAPVAVSPLIPPSQNVITSAEKFGSVTEIGRLL